MGLDVLMEDDRAFLVQDADVEVFRVQINTAIVRVILGVEFHVSFLQLSGMEPPEFGCASEEAQ
jgi:hypothetical protein